MNNKDNQLKEAIVHFDNLPDSARVGVDVVSVLFGRSVPSIWRDVQAGRLPKPIKAGPRCTRWIVGDLRIALMSREPAWNGQLTKT